ncbi:uncharacterized protein LOC131693900 [Topomyia yanbarensis]|uniref:uncharacterized protein LOC131693900 n=1 Tax=Topomyia yanbarensis TaxID=2498891 RepID=UPI00273BC8D6|nr:uncharacterized protein LOC131693900 [Topomyia yanbarensis]
MQIEGGGHEIVSELALQELGVIIDDRLSFNHHVDYISEKSAKATNAIAIIMPNVGGPRSSTRRLLSAVSSSIARYGVIAWGAALKIKWNREQLNSAYRTISCVLSLGSSPRVMQMGIIPAITTIDTIGETPKS